MKSIFRRRDDRGAALILVALSIVSVITVSGLVVDGGHAFGQRRQMQNAADAAALAGARALVKYGVSNPSAISAAVIASAVGNGADASLVTCRLTDEAKVDLGACPTSNTVINTNSTGVHVTVAATSPTSFMKAVGRTSFTARAQATAQNEALRSGSSPFVMCAVGDTDPRAYGDGQIVPIIFPDNDLNHGQFAPAIPTAIGRQYELQDPTTVGCGQGNTFKGLSDSNLEFPTPGPWDLYNGDHGVNVSKSVIAGIEACKGGLTTGCVVAVPLCHGMVPPAAFVLYCERFAAFRIVNVSSSSRIDGVLLDSIVATGGEGGGKPQAGEIGVIKLSE